MAIKEILTPKFHIYQIDENLYAFVIKKNQRLCKKINHIVRHFPADTKFGKDDEPRFVLDERALREVLVLVPTLDSFVSSS